MPRIRPSGSGQGTSQTRLSLCQRTTATDAEGGHYTSWRCTKNETKILRYLREDPGTSRRRGQGGHVDERSKIRQLAIMRKWTVQWTSGQKKIKSGGRGMEMIALEEDCLFSITYPMRSFPSLSPVHFCRGLVHEAFFLST